MIDPSMVLSRDPALLRLPLLPASERSLNELLSALLFSPSPSAYVSSRLGRPRVPFTASFIPGPGDVLGRITPFCFSSSDSTLYFSIS